MTTNKNNQYKLTIDLVPKTCFYSNVRKVVPKSRWDKIRRQAYSGAGHECSICGADDVRLSCHETWSYDDENHVQNLEDFQALCDSCHMIKHAGFSMHTPEGRRKYDREKLIEHFCEVNDCSREDFLEHEDSAFKTWNERSKHEWKQPWIEEVKGDG